SVVEKTSKTLANVTTLASSVAVLFSLFASTIMSIEAAEPVTLSRACSALVLAQHWLHSPSTFPLTSGSENLLFFPVVQSTCGASTDNPLVL
ncbi:hypothetical protein GBF38_012708, partial [Nibea albiflora]